MKTAILAVCPLALCGLISAGEGVVAITSDYPGGNVKVSRLSPGRAEIEADLRDTGQPWFYWNFEATATEPGSVIIFLSITYSLVFSLPVIIILLILPSVILKFNVPSGSSYI